MALGAASIDTRGLKKLQREMKAMGGAAQDFSNPLRGKITKLVTAFFKKQWDTGGRAGGEPWPRLRPATLRAKARARRSNMGILRMSGATRSSFIRRAGPDTFHRVTKDSLEHGSRRFTAALAQEGWTASQWGGRRFKTPRRVPPRKIVPSRLPRTMTNEVEQILIRHVLKAGNAER